MRSTMAQVPARCRFTALGTTAELLVTDPARLRQAEQILRDGLRQLDLACSRFRTDSEISEVHARAGVAVPISALLVRALDTALRAGELTGGLVDPTVGRAVRTLGYDRDFTALGLDDPEPAPATVAVPGWQRVRLDRRSATVLFPHGVEVDLGATAKALGADLAAARIAKMTGCGVLVGLGGDIAVAGKPPAGGWQVSIGEDHAHP
ncbi:MAG: FAD:protein FMN transferase, partial [Sciscionella sp.]